MQITAPSTIQDDSTGSQSRWWSWQATLLLVAAVGITASIVSIDLIGTVGALALGGCVTGIFLIIERRSSPPRPDQLDFAGLARIIESKRQDGVLTTPVAAVMLELRGIAADTVVDGAAAWSEPLAVIARRLTTAEVGDGLVIARIAPHTFGAVVSVPDQSAAVAAAESLVALCRVPVQTPAREIRVDAVAGVSHAEAGERCRGEELLRAADASLRVDGKVAAPVAVSDGRLLRHARRVVEVETEIRYSLDVDLLTARLMPVVDVHNDRIVGLRSAYDWTDVSNTDPEILRSIAHSLGLRRSIETQYLMRSIAAAESLPAEVRRPIVAKIDADRLTDERAVSQIGLLLRASGVDPSNLVFELDCWGVASLGEDAYDKLTELGVGVGIALRYYQGWEKVPSHLVGRLEAVSVQAADVLDPGGVEPSALQISRLIRMLDGDTEKVTVSGVDQTAVALELSAAGLPLQCGMVHGLPMAAGDLRTWLDDRTTI